MINQYLIDIFGEAHPVIVGFTKTDKNGLISVTHEGTVKRIHPSRLSKTDSPVRINAGSVSVYVKDGKIMEETGHKSSTFAGLKDYAETILVKDGGQFNHSTTIKTICLIVGDRSIKFNIYNDNLEKIKDKLEEFKNGTTGNPTDIAKLTTKCEKEGYIKLE